MDKKVIYGIIGVVAVVVIAIVIGIFTLSPKEETTSNDTTQSTTQSSTTAQKPTDSKQSEQLELPTLAECSATSTPYMYDFLYGTLAWHDKNTPVPTSTNGVKIFCAAQNNKTKKLYFQFSTSPQRLFKGWNVYAPYTTGIRESDLFTKEEFDKLEQKPSAPTLDDAYSALGTDDYTVQENGWTFTFAWITPTETKGKYWSTDKTTYYTSLAENSALPIALENTSGTEFNDGKGINKDYVEARLLDTIKSDTGIDVTSLTWYKNHNLGETVTLYCDKNTKIDSSSYMDKREDGMPLSTSTNNYIAKFEELHNNGEVKITMQPGELVQTSGTYLDVFGNTCAYTSGETLYSIGNDMGYISQSTLKQVCDIYGFDTSTIF